MTRVKRGVNAHRRHRKTIKAAKGFRGLRHNHFKQATNALYKAEGYAFIGRKQKKRLFRALWITRINAACRPLGISYSRLIDFMTKKDVQIDRKILAELATNDLETFKQIVEFVQK
ncbi:MAG: 50S ribosomal protein L20 [Candidatus Gracilibacteria bacterium]|jgi:large subunit ribosomal protein L20